MNKDIDKAAREYAEHLYRSCFDDLGEPIPAEIDLRLTKLASDYENFAAGAQSRQSEIDELRTKLKEQELIIYGIEEGAEEWEALAMGAEFREKKLVEALEEAIGWIPVDKRLPAINEVVQVREQHPYDETYFTYDYCSHDGKEWTLNDYCKVKKPTHWQSIDNLKGIKLLEKYGKK